jgi:hypothetical protein
MVDAPAVEVIMTVTDDRTEALLNGDHQDAPEPGSVNDLLELLEECVAEQRQYAAMFRALDTPAGVLKWFRRLSIAEQQVVLTESGAAERQALEVAQARSEVLQQVRAQVLSTGVTAEVARDLLGSFWRDT